MFTKNYRTGVDSASTDTIIATLVIASAFISPALFGADEKAIFPSTSHAVLARVNGKSVEGTRESAADATQVDAMLRVIAVHDEGEVDRAVSLWRHIALPQDSVVWKHLGLGVAHLHAGRLKTAEIELAYALEHDPGNAAVHYFRGLLRLEQATERDTGRESNDELGRSYRLKAVRELNLTLKYARSTYLDSPLVSVRFDHDTASTNAPMPTVGVLLTALGADGLEGKAHGLLAHLYLDQACAEQAEHHLDKASDHGISVPYGYRRVGALYEESGRSTDAMRAYSKAAKGGDHLARLGTTPLQYLDRAFDSLL